MILILDADKSTSVIVDKVKQRGDIFIRPVLKDFGGMEKSEDGSGSHIAAKGMDFHVHFYLDLFFEKTVKRVFDKVLNIEMDYEMVTMNDAAKKQRLHTIVLDSISGLGESVRLAIIEGSKFSQMTRDLWGKYAVRIGNLAAAIRDIPIRFIVTCHIDSFEDSIGGVQEFPAIKGSQKTDMLRWFDVIVYNVVQEHGAIMWNVKKSDERPFIRSRVPIAEWKDKEFVEPNFEPVYNAYGKSRFKMLLIGHSGSGKTTSLLTIPQVTSKPNVKEQKQPDSTNQRTSDPEPNVESQRNNEETEVIT